MNKKWRPNRTIRLIDYIAVCTDSNKLSSFFSEHDFCHSIQNIEIYTKRIVIKTHFLAGT